MNPVDQPEAWVCVQAHGAALIPKETPRGDGEAASGGVSCSCWGVTRVEDPRRTEEGDSVCSFNHWTTREVLTLHFLMLLPAPTILILVHLKNKLRFLKEP